MPISIEGQAWPRAARKYSKGHRPWLVSRQGWSSFDSNPLYMQHLLSSMPRRNISSMRFVFLALCFLAVTVSAAPVQVRSPNLLTPSSRH